MTILRPSTAVTFRIVAGLALVVPSGCMSALTTASLRDVVRDTIDSLAEATADDADVAASLVTDDTTAAEPVVSEPAKPLSLDEAVDRAVSRLNGVGELDAATQATLLSILENTNPQDWPAAIDAFTASLEVHRPAKPSVPRAQASVVQVAAVEPKPAEPLMFPAPGEPEPLPAVDPPLAFPAPPAPPVTEPATIAFVEAARPVGPEPRMLPAPVPPADESGEASEPSVASDPLVVIEPLGAEEPLRPDDLPALEPPPAVAEPRLAICNACFVTRVRAWGVVDRFPEATFRPGQDVIVYFELDAPTARESAAGHTTSIDTIFRLVAADGRQIGQWDFEPIDQTSHAPRRDYFARYFLRIPETATAGPCRLEFMVTDLVTGTSTQAHLDLDVR
jgi:hypothetical protein